MEAKHKPFGGTGVSDILRQNVFVSHKPYLQTEVWDSLGHQNAVLTHFAACSLSDAIGSMPRLWRTWSPWSTRIPKRLIWGVSSITTATR